jgi:hypothetical protein
LVVMKVDPQLSSSYLSSRKMHTSNGARMCVTTNRMYWLGPEALWITYEGLVCNNEVYHERVGEVSNSVSHSLNPVIVRHCR